MASSLSTSFRRPRSLAELSKRREKLLARAQRERKRLDKVRDARLAAGGLFAASLVASAVWPRLRAELAIVAAFAAVYAPLAIRSRRLEDWIGSLQALADYVDRAIARREGLAPLLPKDADGAPPLTPRESGLAQDLAVVGDRSLLSLVDETMTHGGRLALRARLLADPRDAESVRARQAAIRGLTRDRWRLVRARLLADRSALRISSHELLRLVEKPLIPLGAGARAWACAALWGAFAASVVLLGVGAIDARWSAMAWIAFAAASHWTLQSWGPVFLRGEGVAHHAGALGKLWGELERLARASARAAEALPAIAREPITLDVRRLERALSWASVESHALLFLGINSLLPWSVLADLKLERARRRLAKRVPAALEELHAFEATASLALFAAEHGGTWPEIREGSTIEAEGLEHPLLPFSRAVGNSFHLGGARPPAALLTGSNMSGKSTFLRAIGCAQLMANAGAPVRAERYACGPLSVETCVQVSDSLGDGISYFYAEVLRLKEVLAAADGSSRRPVLALIDEIFRGTNNRERLAGSRAILRHLAASGALSAVSTHDLELTALGDVRIENWHFRDEAESGRLRFDYRLRPGPCPTTNALKIMRQQGLPVEDALAD